MSRTEKLRALSRRALVERNRLDRLADDLTSSGYDLTARYVRRSAGAIYSIHLSLDHIASANRDPRGAKRAGHNSDPAR